MDTSDMIDLLGQIRTDRPELFQSAAEFAIREYRDKMADLHETHASRWNRAHWTFRVIATK